MRKIFLLITILFTVNVWAQKDFTLTTKTPYEWAPLADGEVNIHSKLTNTSNNVGDTMFWIEYIGATIPSAWSLGMCTNLQCFSVIGGVLKESFSSLKGVQSDLKATHSFANTPGTGYSRFIVYREGYKNLADTITFNSKAAGTGVKTNSKAIEASISPNPVKNELVITISDINVTSISIVNLVGKEVMKLDLKAGKSFDVSSLPNGIYFLSIKKGDASFNKKFIISK